MKFTPQDKIVNDQWETLTPDELRVRLSDSTLELLNMIEEKNDASLILRKKQEVEAIQAAISKKGNGQKH